MMTNNTPDYENNLAFAPTSADDLNKQERQSDVLVSALEKCEKLEKQIKRLQFENQHVIWLKHRNEALDKDNKQLRQLLRECGEKLEELNHGTDVYQGDLTEKWKKGELESGWYYVKGEKMYEGISIHWIEYPIPAIEKRCIQEVLAPVPSYEEWQAKNEENKNLYKMLDVLNGHLDSLLKEDNENQQLKELLIGCKANFMYRKQLLEKLEELENPTKDIVSRINAIIGESEEQSNDD